MSSVEVRAHTIRVIWVGAEPPDAFAQGLASWFQVRPIIELESSSVLRLVESSAAKDASFTSVWLDLRQLPRVRLYFIAAPRGAASKYLLHESLLEAGLSELGIEQLAQAVYSSLIALEEGNARSSFSDLERSAAETATQLSESGRTPKKTDTSSTSSKSASPRVPSRALGPYENAAPQRLSVPRDPGHSDDFAWHLALGQGYGAALRGGEGIAHGPTLWAMLGQSSRSLRLGGFVAARYTLPVEREAQRVSVRLDGFQFRCGPTQETSLGRGIWLSFGVGLGVDAMRAEPRTSDASKLALKGGWYDRGVATAFVALSIPTAIGGLVFKGDVDVQLHDNHYDLVTHTGARQRLIVPSRIQPGFTILLRFDSKP